jgi:hypothetical protein
MSVYTDENHVAHIDFPHMTQYLSYSKSLTSERFSDTGEKYPYLEEEGLSPQKYLATEEDGENISRRDSLWSAFPVEKNELTAIEKKENNGQENNGPTCHHTRIHSHIYTHSLSWSLTSSTCALTLTLSLLNK